MSRDTTFRNFTASQAAAYASGRGGAYPEPIYQTLTDFHHGLRNLCLDVGTGPGKAVWDLLHYFDQCIGCDASEQMIEQAKKDAETRGVSDRITFVTAAAEECGTKALSESGVQAGSVDAITVAMAAHWFEYPAFYLSAAQALRPGGTLALWTSGSKYCHPSVPGHEKIQALLQKLEDDLLGPYMTAGNRLARHCYDELPLPWTASSSAARNPAAELFDERAFERKHWDRGGVPSAPALADGTPGPYIFGREIAVERGVKSFDSSGPVIRWREANPERAHTEEDVVSIMVKSLKEVVGERAKLVIGPSCTLLLFRRT